MAELRDLVAFRSDQFAPVLPEECQVNPGVYGAELAFWLSQELARAGIPTSYPSSEDWGWLIEYLPDSGSEFAVCCRNVGDARDHWLLSLRRFPRKLFGRDKPSYSEIIVLVQGIRALLCTTASVTDVTWRWVPDGAA